MILLLLLAAGGVGGCASAPLVGRGEAMIRTELYFGTRQPEGTEIAEETWRAFLDTAITPRFPAGLTVIDAIGQYRGAAGRIDRERTKLVVVFHAGGPTVEAAIEAIIEGYKRTFRQESVLEVSAPVRAAF